MKIYSLLALLTVSLCVRMTCAEEGKTYAVSMVRPMEKGRIYSVAALGVTHESTVIRWAGSIVEQQTKDVRCELAAAAEVLESDASNLPTRVRFRVFWLKKRTPVGQEEALLDRNTEVEAYRSGDGIRYQIGSDPVSEELHEVLALVMRLPDPADAAVFGKRENARPGDRWPVNGIEATARFLENGLIVQPDDLAALVTFRGVGDQLGRECMDVGVEMKAVNAGPALPDGFRLLTGTLEVLLSGKIPTDPSQPVMEESNEFMLQCEAEGGTEGRILDVKTEITRTYRARCVAYGS